MEPTTLSAGASILSKASGLTDYLEYWQNYKGEQVDIRNQSLRQAGRRKQYVEDTVITRGTIKAIHGQPAGLLLTEVEELHRRRKLGGDSFDDATSHSSVMSDDVRRLRQVDEKLVTFSEIGELELTEHAADADRSVENMDAL